MFWALVYLFSSCVELCANCSLEINLRSFKQHLHPESSLLHVESTRLSRNYPCLPQQNKLCIQISYEQVLSISISSENRIEHEARHSLSERSYTCSRMYTYGLSIKMCGNNILPTEKRSMPPHAYYMLDHQEVSCPN